MQEGIASHRLRCLDFAATNLFSLTFYGVICDKILFLTICEEAKRGHGGNWTKAGQCPICLPNTVRR